VVDQEKKPEDPRGYSPEAHKEVNLIFGSLDSYEPKRKQNLSTQEVMVANPATSKYLRWS
jgi:hypothetical protein